MFVGRSDEQSRLGALIDGARRGQSSAVILYGEPGVGKSTLLERAIRDADEFIVLGAQPLQAESELAFAGLADLLRPVLELRQLIPPPQQQALDSALALGPASAGDRFAVAAATLSLLAAAAERSPVLAVVDDAHWLDEPSRVALVFAARRLVSEGIVLLLAMRERDWLHDAGLATLRLDGLGQADAAALLDDAAGDLGSVVRARLLADTRGNPLALLEALATLTPAQRKGVEPAPDPLAVGAALDRAFAGHLDALPDDTRRALLIAAASDTGSIGEILAALHQAGLDPRALDEGERAGVITRTVDRVSFRHPLVRSAAYHAHGPIERRAAHRALAGAVQADERAAWHLAAASAEPDEEVAGLLEAAAETALARSAYAAAARAFETAAVLSVADHDRLRRTTAAGRALWLAGDPDGANAALAAVLDTVREPTARAQIQMLRGATMVFTRPVAETFSLLISEAERVQGTDRLLASEMYSIATMVCFMAGDPGRAQTTARRAVEAADPDAGAVGSAARLSLGLAVAAGGHVAEAFGLINPVLAGLAPTDLDHRDGALSLAMAGVLQALVWLECLDPARVTVEGMIAEARSAGAATILPFALATLSEIEVRFGSIPAAYAAAAESVQLSQDTGQAVESSFSYVTLARVEALLGHDVECRALVATALQTALRTGADSIRTYSASVLGLLELSLGQPDRAATHLRECGRLQAIQRMKLPTAVPFAGDLIEALVRSGDPAGAETAVRAIDASARETGLRWPAAIAARGRGLLADEADYEAAFADALELHGDLMPFDRARTELCLGMRRRRSRRRADARAALHRALSYFETTGVEPWASQARAELRAAGEAHLARNGSSPSLQILTPQELQVALTVAGGATNREAAAALFLSTKTVEFHLSNTYRKLGVRSRAELVRRVDGLG